MAPRGIRRVPPKVPEFPGLAQKLREDTVEHLRRRVRGDLGQWVFDQNNAIQKKIAEIQEVFDAFKSLNRVYYEALRHGLGDDLADEVFGEDITVEPQLFTLEDVRRWLEPDGTPKGKGKGKETAVVDWVAEVEENVGVESTAVGTPSSTPFPEPPPGSTGGSQSDDGEETVNREETTNGEGTANREKKLDDIGVAL